MPNCKIAEKCNIGQNVVISPEVILGKNCKVQNKVYIWTGVTGKDDVFFGTSMVFMNVSNQRSANYEKRLVKCGATIGANATIVWGNTIGAYVYIGAGAGITKEVVPYCLVVRNPARQIGWMCEYGHRLDFDKKGMAICPESGITYELKNGIVKKA